MEFADESDQISPIARLEFSSGGGFGAWILSSINLVRHCERAGWTPVLDYHSGCENPFFDPAYGNNMWEQYFEPVGGLSVSELDARLADPEDPLSPEHVVGLGQAEALRIIEEHPESVYTFTFGHWRLNPPEDLAGWYDDQREQGRRTVGAAVHPKPHIVEKVEAFRRSHIGDRKVLGIHMRGTDLHYAPPVSPAEYFEPIAKYLEAEPEARIYLATDQAQYLDLMQERYGDRLLAFDCDRSTTSVAPFELEEISPYKKGEDVLIDILLLSQCDFLLKGASNVGEFALYFNPALCCLDLSLDKRRAFGQDYGSGWDVVSNKPAWELVGKGDLATVRDDAASQSIGQAAAYFLRREVWSRVVRSVRWSRRQWTREEEK